MMKKPHPISTRPTPSPISGKTIPILGLCVLFLLIARLFASEIAWTRFQGRVKALNHKTKDITLQMKDGDLISLKVTDEMEITRDKEKVALSAITIDDKITLLYLPQEKATFDSDLPKR